MHTCMVAVEKIKGQSEDKKMTLEIKIRSMKKKAEHLQYEVARAKDQSNNLEGKIKGKK